MKESEAKRLAVRTVWNGKANVCPHCGKVPEVFYIVTGHDHTDDRIDWCPCRDTSELQQLRTTNAEQAERISQLESTPADKREDLRCVISDLCDQVRERDARIKALEDALREWRKDHWSDSQLCDFIDELIGE